MSSASRKLASDLQTTRPPTATRGCIDTTCLSWWWARCARNMWRVKNINKYTKNCASRWSFTKNHYMMHGQQNIKFFMKTVQWERRCSMRTDRQTWRSYQSLYANLRTRLRTAHCQLRTLPVAVNQRSRIRHDFRMALHYKGSSEQQLLLHSNYLYL